MKNLIYKLKIYVLKKLYIIIKNYNLENNIIFFLNIYK